MDIVVLLKLVELATSQLYLPSKLDLQLDPKFIQWHNENKFKT